MSKANEFIEMIRTEEGIGDALMISHQGEVITKPVKKDTARFVSMISYLAMSAIELKKLIGFTSPSYITVNLELEQRILLVFGRNAHLVVELEYGLSPDSLIAKLSGPLKNAAF